MKGLIHCLALLMVLPVFAGISVAQSSPDFKIIVHTENPVDRISKEHASRLFLKKDPCWIDGTDAVPVDQLTDSPVRVSFSKEIIGKNASSVARYWQMLVFSGRGTPPPTRASDEEVIEFVKEHPGAIGYVASACSADGVKVVKLAE
jgi:ABC-type phosphate transport system substrate-binding protein